ncbi:hypothetical protein GCM10011533_14160 [Streptosporangium jomthongense]|uniref:FecR domain-containing protein n=1 Tax=Marinobacter aromaticivorans TaxID=1494078 RepID=A0ABW2IUN7_9GAMM|nr:FecR domain-containing protein [Marinobacter aromaticivorans]GGE62945.1 hypothetical protein GCM10011533_14160 [Streptosporangium jomthongense]
MRFFTKLGRSNTCRVLLAFSALLLATIGVTAEQVRVEEVSGLVQFRATANDAWEKAEAGMSVSVPVEFRTLEDSTGLLAQSGSEFELKSSSHVVLQADADGADGLVTKIKQWFGTVFYRIERQPDQFSVETPFLVSTVKGTRFVIVSTQSSSTVTLTEGSLEVLDIATGSIQMLEPGDVAGIGAEQAGIRSYKQIPQRSAASPASAPDAFQPAIDDTQDSFESALEAMTEVASEQAVIAADNPGSNQGADDAGAGPEPDGNDGAGDDGDTGGGADDGSDDDMGGGHGNGNGNGHYDHGNGNGNGHDDHDHDDDDDDDDDD